MLRHQYELMTGSDVNTTDGINLLLEVMPTVYTPLTDECHYQQQHEGK